LAESQSGLLFHHWLTRVASAGGLNWTDKERDVVETLANGREAAVLPVVVGVVPTTT